MSRISATSLLASLKRSLGGGLKASLSSEMDFISVPGFPGWLCFLAHAGMDVVTTFYNTFHSRSKFCHGVWNLCCVKKSLLELDVTLRQASEVPESMLLISNKLLIALALSVYYDKSHEVTE